MLVADSMIRAEIFEQASVPDSSAVYMLPGSSYHGIVALASTLPYAVRNPLQGPQRVPTAAFA